MPKRLFWRLYISFAVLAIVCIALTGVVAHHIITKDHLERLERELFSDARLISLQVEKHLGEDNEKARQIVLSLGEEFEPRTTVILPDGIVVGETDEDPEVMENHADRPEIRQAIKEGRGKEQRISPTLGITMLYVAVRVGSAESPKGVVRCALPVTEVEEQLADFTRMIIACCGLGVGLALVISLFISLKITLPVTHMTEVAADVAAGQLDRRADVTSKDEFGRLAEALNTMRAKLVSQITTMERDRNQLETVLGAMVEGVIAINSREHIVFINDAAAGALETTPAEATGNLLWEVSRNPALGRFVEEAKKEGGAKTFQWSLPGGETHYYELTIAPVTAPKRVEEATTAEESPSHILVFHDVTRLRKLERVRMDFIANVSHELKSPLTSIKGFVETLREGGLQEPGKAAKFLEIIDRHTQRLDNLVSDLLELSAIESPDFAPDRQPMSLAGAAEKAKELLAQKISEKRLNVEVRTKGGVPTISADRARMEQVFLNLLDNAVKYTDEGGDIGISIEPGDGSVWVAVTDTGIGIPGKDLPRIFERFYRVDKARSRELGGTGLGLAIVKHIVLQHGGDIRAESTPGRGTTITFNIPVE